MRRGAGTVSKTLVTEGIDKGPSSVGRQWQSFPGAALPFVPVLHRQSAHL